MGCTPLVNPKSGHQDRDNTDKIVLKLNNQNIIDWFKQKVKEIRQFARPHIRPLKKLEINQSKGVKRKVMASY